jgi:hypothetical protein
LPTVPFIVAIARDPALLRSLAFALEAHGHKVETFRTWSSARDRASLAFCVILDGGETEMERKACLDSLPPATGIILLADDDTAHPERGGVLILHKPLTGLDVVTALAALKTANT